MSKHIEQTKTPEEGELEAKLLELSSLEAELAQKELDMATLNAELQATESSYLRVVGVKFLELDRIKAVIVEILAAREPGSQEAQAEALEARARAQETARETGDVSTPRKSEGFSATPEIKDLYRNIAKRVHPDLAVDETDQVRRTKVMAEVNKAYEVGDVERLKAILREWESSPESIPGEDVSSRLIRTIRMIARVRERIAQIGKEIHTLMASDIQRLKLRVEEAAQEGRDLLAEMSQKVDAEIIAAKAMLHELTS